MSTQRRTFGNNSNILTYLSLFISVRHGKLPSKRVASKRSRWKQPMICLHRIILFILFFAIYFDGTAVICKGEEYPVPVKRIPSNEVPVTDSKKNAGIVLATFFRDVISPVDGDRCPSLPSCSSYSVSAFKKHGFLTGWVMTVDRLIHEADEGSVSPSLYYNGRLRTLDPVENNDFWWFCEDESTGQ